MSIPGYDDPSWLARALDRVGEPWALLVVRELAYGPKRFSELRRGLGGASHAALTQRLAELEASGVVRGCRLPPPVSASAYELSELGRDLLPVLVTLARWGSQLPSSSGRELSPDAFWLQLQAAYQPGRAGSGRILVRVEDDEIEARYDDEALSWSRDVSANVGATVQASLATLHRALLGHSGLADPIRTHKIKLSGDVEQARRFLAAFAPPG